jgi:hypothetical protein
MNCLYFRSTLIQPQVLVAFVRLAQSFIYCVMFYRLVFVFSSPFSFWLLHQRISRNADIWLNNMSHKNLTKALRRVWRYQRGNHNPYIEEEQTTQWPKEKVQKDKQRPTRPTHKTKDRVTRTPLKTGGELMCSRRVSSSCSTSDIFCLSDYIFLKVSTSVCLMNWHKGIWFCSEHYDWYVANDCHLFHPCCKRWTGK